MIGRKIAMQPATSNNPHLHANRLLLQDSDNRTYGYARAYALEDRTQPKLHLYDIKFFQKLKLIGPPRTLSIGNDIKSTRDTRGFYIELESTGATDVNYVTDSEILVVDYNKPFRKGQTIRSSINSINAEIESATTYSWANITNIRSKTGTFKVEKKSLAKLQNAAGRLFAETESAVKTARDDSKVFDNDFEVLFANPPTIASNSGTVAITPNTGDTLFSTANANGDFTRTRIDDGNEISKTLKYKYLKIRNDRTSSSINYGWSAQDRESTLLYSDIYEVYGISKSDANNTFSHFKQINVSISGGGIIPQGSIITGSISGCRGLVALSNTDKGETEETDMNEKEIKQMKGKNKVIVMPQVPGSGKNKYQMNSNEMEGPFITEKAVSKAQQRFMGMVYATKKGEKPSSPEVAKAAEGMSEKDAKKYAKTKHKGLPEVKGERDEKRDRRADYSYRAMIKNKLRAGIGVKNPMVLADPEKLEKDFDKIATATSVKSAMDEEKRDPFADKPYDKYGRYKDPKARQRARERAAALRNQDRQSGRRTYGSRLGYDDKEWDE